MITPYRYLYCCSKMYLSACKLSDLVEGQASVRKDTQKLRVGIRAARLRAARLPPSFHQSFALCEDGVWGVWLAATGLWRLVSVFSDLDW